MVRKTGKGAKAFFRLVGREGKKEMKSGKNDFKKRKRKRQE